MRKEKKGPTAVSTFRHPDARFTQRLAARAAEQGCPEPNRYIRELVERDLAGQVVDVTEAEIKRRDLVERVENIEHALTAFASRSRENTEQVRELRADVAAITAHLEQLYSVNRQLIELLHARFEQPREREFMTRSERAFDAKTSSQTV